MAHITGSAFGETIDAADGVTNDGDLIFGNGGGDTIYGLGGDDIIDGGPGGLFNGDYIDGGSGIDTAVYGGSNTGVTIDLSLGEGHGGEADGDTLVSIENVDGSPYGDLLIGDEDDNILRGGGQGPSYLDDTGIDWLQGWGGDDILDGEAANDVLEGGSNNDTLIGGAGADTLDGGTGIDTAEYSPYVGGANDTVNLATGTGTAGDALGDTLAGIENVNGGAGDDTLTGDSGANVLDGSFDNDTLTGGGGPDVLIGGSGIDTAIYSDSPTASSVTVNLTSGLGFGGTAEGDALDGIENVVGSTHGDTLTGDENANVLDGRGGNDELKGGGGADELIGGDGAEIDTASYNDSASGVTVNLRTGLGTGGTAQGDTLDGIENVTGSGLDDVLIGDDLTSTLTGGNSLFGSNGDDALKGGGGADVLDGGEDSDTADYSDSVSGVTINLRSGTADGGAADGDTLISIENLGGSGHADTLTGDDEANRLDGSGGNDVLKGGRGADTLIGGNFGSDTASYSDSGAGVSVNLTAGTGSGGTAAGDTLTGIEHLTGSHHADTLTGDAGINILRGAAGNDTLDGKGGADTMIGSTGNDTYYVDQAGDVVTEAAGEGTDWIVASITYTLGATIENLRLTGLGAIHGTGNSDDNLIYGNSGNNTLDGRLGVDTLAGGFGDDIYLIGDADYTDVVAEAANEGRDEVRTTQWVYELGDNVENLTFNGNGSFIGTGNDLANVLTGKTSGDVLIGAGGDDRLVGGGDADTMLGGTDNDTYLVDNVRDIVTEAANEGTDTVEASITYTLGTDVENLTLTGSWAIDGTGNTLVNNITGNGAANVLDGGQGADTMVGRGGNDWFFVDNAGDMVNDGVGEGAADRVFATAHYALNTGAQIEIISTTNHAGTTAINLSGNEFGQTLQGNAGNNVLDGKGGADAMVGLAGNDWFLVDSAGDTVNEQTGGGTADRVFSGVHYTLAPTADVEILSTTTTAGTVTIDLTGNAIANTIYGNNGANVLNGGAGNDTLQGFGGADVYLFNTALGAAANVDTIVGYVISQNVIHLENAIFTGLADGALAAGAFRVGAAAADADDRVIYNTTTGALIFDSNGNVAGGATQFATLSAGLAMSAAEFFVV